MPDHTNIWYRKDDPGETVALMSQERHPNGAVIISFITPEHLKGNEHRLPATDFYNMYYNPLREDDPAEPPVRPTSFSQAKQWRRWAIHIEAELAETKAELENARRALVPKDGLASC